MTTFIALLRAVNLGGTGRFPMADLRAMCEQTGFQDVRTYIASGNVVFDSDQSPAEVKRTLERRLLAYAGKTVGVAVRTADEMAEVFARNPFPDAPRNRTVAIFLDAPPPPAALQNVSGQGEERMACGQREIYVHYGAGMGRSRLTIPAAANGTARNMNTIGKLVSMTSR